MKQTFFTALIVIFLAASFFLFQNCSSHPLNQSSLSSKDTEGSTITPELSSNIDPNNSIITDSGVTIGPKELKNLTADLRLESPENCEEICQEQQCLEAFENESTVCAGDANSTACTAASQDLKTCQTESAEACSRDRGLCRPLNIPPDPYTLTSFTVPSGYKRAKVVVEHCTDRNDALIIEGPRMYFKTLNSGALWNARFGANVGRGPLCKKEGLLDIAKVKIQMSDPSSPFEAQSFLAEQEYIWKLPGAVSFPITTDMISDMNTSEPVFVHLKSIVGPGAKLHKIYDNYNEKSQLSFIMEYIFWYDPKYVTTFDFYYKKSVREYSDYN